MKRNSKTKRAELGRPLTKEEAEEWFKQMGSPIQVAARYQRQQYLIGPTLFPTYWYVLKLALFWLTAVYVVARVITVAAQGSSVEAYAGIARGAALDLARECSDHHADFCGD